MSALDFCITSKDYDFCLPFQYSIHTLKEELREIDSTNLPKLVQKTLDVLEEMTDALQSTFPFVSTL